VSARGSNLERALGDFLAFDLRKIGAAGWGFGFDGRRRRHERGALEMRQQRKQVGRGDHVELPGPRRLTALRGRADQPFVQRRRVDRRQQHPGRRRNAPVEAQLADRHIVG
jgi:hypothetical protein